MNGIYACSVCYIGAPDDPMTVSLRYAIIFMLSILAFMFVFLGKFFLNVRKRSKILTQIN